MTGFFAILDDIAALMDDVAVMAKVATRKTAGVLGDDLAVGAEKASSFRASRELPVLWAITKGSFLRWRNSQDDDAIHFWTARCLRIRRGQSTGY